MSEESPPTQHPAEGPIRRTIDLCVFAPVGVAVSVVEELPDLIAKGRRHVEVHLGNALVVGRFVVARGQEQVSARIDELFASPEHARGRRAPRPRAEEGTGAAARTPGGSGGGPGDTGRPDVDPAAAAVVASALADYDTLSASQVVRRLESLGPEELRAVQRYEASTRNRRTILHRAGQLLEERPAGPSYD